MRYRVTMTVMVANLGLVDLDLGSLPDVATYCPSRMVEHAKVKSTQPMSAATTVNL